MPLVISQRGSIWLVTATTNVHRAIFCGGPGGDDSVFH